MLSHLAALVIGLVAVLWLWDDTDSLLGKLDGKKVLVTGASAGIGRELAYEFSRHGSHVTVTARRRQVLEEVSKECDVLGPKNRSHLVVEGDLGNLTITQRVIERAAALMGGLDILVLNHINPHPIEAYKGDNSGLMQMHKIMDVNFRSYVHLATHALPHLTKSHGRIVVINSLVGKTSHPLLAAYTASKHALDGFFSSLRNQFRFKGQDVGITSCFLGFIGTDSAVRGISAAGQTRLLSMVKPAAPEDTAKAIVRAVVKGTNDLYYPWMDVRLSALAYSVWPEFMDWLLRWLAV